MKRNEWLEVMRYLSLVTWLGLTMAVAIGLGWLIGTRLEALFGGFAWSVAGLLAGVVGGFIALWSTVKKFIPWE